MIKQKNLQLNKGSTTSLLSHKNKNAINDDEKAEKNKVRVIKHEPVMNLN